MKLCESGGALAADLGVPVSKMEESIAAHYHPSLRTAQDPVGGPFPAYPSGKSLDETSGKTGSGKKFYHGRRASSDVGSGTATRVYRQRDRPVLISIIQF